MSVCQEDGRDCETDHRKPPWCRVGMPGGVRGRDCEVPAYSIVLNLSIFCLFVSVFSGTISVLKKAFYSSKTMCLGAKLPMEPFDIKIRKFVNPLCNNRNTEKRIQVYYILISIISGRCMGSNGFRGSRHAFAPANAERKTGFLDENRKITKRTHFGSSGV